MKAEKKSVSHKIKIARGQLDAVLKMIEDDQYCVDIETNRYEQYRGVLAEADVCKDDLSVIRKIHINRMQKSGTSKMMQVDMVYLNLLQETQQLLSVMRHQLRSAKKFMED